MRSKWGSNRGQIAAGVKMSKSDGADNGLARFVALAFVWCAAVPSAAFAADLPAPVLPPVYKEPPAVYSWTGFYVGGNFGAAWNGLSASNFSDTVGSTFTAPTNVQFMGGGQLGVNYQFGDGVVIGAEAMFDWLPNTQNAQITATAPDNTAAFIDTINNRWVTTVTARLGYAWDRVFFYGRGGGAWVGGAGSPGMTVGGTPVTLTGSSNSDFGWTAGFGLEWAFLSNWSLRAEYDYISLNNQTFTAAPGPTTFGGDVITYSDRSISMMTVGVDYKLGGW